MGAVSEESTKGGYLVFDVASQGSLFIKWSSTPIDKALMFFKPTKKVPAFKYKGTAKEELARKMHCNVPQFFMGICEYLKIARQFDGLLTVYETPSVVGGTWIPPVGVTLLKGTKLQHIQINQPHLLTDQDACAAWNLNINPYQGVSTLGQSQFLNKSKNNNGWGFEFS